MELNVFMVSQILTKDPDHEVQSFLDRLEEEMVREAQIKAEQDSLKALEDADAVVVPPVVP